MIVHHSSHFSISLLSFSVSQVLAWEGRNFETTQILTVIKYTLRAAPNSFELHTQTFTTSTLWRIDSISVRNLLVIGS